MKYDIALSFAGEDRDYVERVAARLRTLKVKVFYDRYERVDLWGRDLYEHLSDVYQHKAQFTVMFISRHYADKLWTRHERKSAQARALRDGEAYILPARFDDTAVPGLLSTTGYLDLRQLSPEAVAEAICEKLGCPVPVIDTASSERRDAPVNHQRNRARIFFILVIVGVVVFAAQTLPSLRTSSGTQPNEEQGDELNSDEGGQELLRLGVVPGVVPSFDLGDYCGEYTEPSDTSLKTAESLYHFDAGSPELADSLSGFLMKHEHKIIYLEMSLCPSNIKGDWDNPTGFDLSIGYAGPTIQLVDTEKGDISISSSGNQNRYFKGYFKVLGYHTAPQDRRIEVEMAPVPIETVTPVQTKVGN